MSKFLFKSLFKHPFKPRLKLNALNVRTIFFSTLALTLCGNISLVNAGITQINKSSNQQQVLTQSELLDKLHLVQGKGTFVQKKYFKFLSEPIVSKGLFILQNQTALWETQNPIFSQLLLTPKAIFTRLDSSNSYRSLVKNGEFSRLLSTLLSGEFKKNDWKDIEVTTLNCIKLVPINNSLEKVFSKVEVCLIDNLSREINLMDSNNNKTQIKMLITNLDINEVDASQLIPTNIKTEAL